MDKVILAQQFNNLLIGLGGAFLAMMAIVTAIHVKETGPGAEMKNFARRDFLAASSSLVVCALVGVVCMSMISAGSSIAPLKDDAAFHVACSFLFLCTFGLLECLNTLGLLLLVHDEDEAVLRGASERESSFRIRSLLSGEAKLTELPPFQKGQFIFGWTLRFFLMLSTVFSIGSSLLYSATQKSDPSFSFWLVLTVPLIVPLIAAIATVKRRKDHKDMEVSPIPPTVTIKSLSVCILLALFFHGWIVALLPGWVTIMINLTIVLFSAVSTHFTMNRPVLYAQVVYGIGREKSRN